VSKFFRRLFGGKQQKAVMSDAATTAPLNDQQLQAIIAGSTPRVETQQLMAGCAQSVGRQRELNEDSLLVLTSTIAGNGSNVPFGLYIIADGMGGHQYGEVASSAAVRAVSGYVVRKFYPYLFNQPAEPVEEPLQEIMQAAVNEAQRVVQRQAPGGGTTLTAALVLGNQITLAHVGDSRAYAIRPDGRIEAITRDHSLVRRLEELGHISPEEAAAYPHRNVLYRAIGQGEVLEAEIATVPFPPAGYLMICSDGLWGVLNDRDIYRIVNDASGLQVACQNLVAAANAAGGPDNISVILIQLLN
jgi:serine/threonine protein phosphatase PrpC